MARVRSRGSRSTEARLRASLASRGVFGWRQNPIGIFGRPDFVFPNSRLAIFVDGCFWHGCPLCFRKPKSNRSYWQAKISRNRQRDKQVSIALSRQGWKILRFWEHQIQKDLCKVTFSISSLLVSSGKFKRCSEPKSEVSLVAEGAVGYLRSSD